MTSEKKNLPVQQTRILSLLDLPEDGLSTVLFCQPKAKSYNSKAEYPKVKKRVAQTQSRNKFTTNVLRT